MSYPRPCLLLCVCIIAVSQSTATIIFHAPYINDIEGHVIANQAISGGPVMLSYGLGNDAVSQTVRSWNLGDFTGLSSDRPDVQQRGISESYGSSSVQMVGDAAGGHIHTWSSSEHNIYNLANNQYAYGFPSSDVHYLWPTKTSTLYLSTLLQIPSLYLEGKGMAAYMQLSLYLRSVRGPGAMWFLVSLFDNRGTFNEDLMYDAGTATPFVLTYASEHAKLKFSKSLSGSVVSTPWSGWHNYTIAVTYDMMANAISEMSARFGTKMESDPSYWTANLIAIQGELYWPQGTNGRMGWSCKGLRLETRP